MDMNVTTIIGAVLRIAQASGAAKVMRGTANRADPTAYEDWTFFAYFDHDPLHQYTADVPLDQHPNRMPTPPVQEAMLYFVRVQDVCWGLEVEMRRCNEAGRAGPLTLGFYIDRDDAKRKGRDKDGISRPTINGVDYAALMTAFIREAEFHQAAPLHWLEGWEEQENDYDMYRQWRP